MKFLILNYMIKLFTGSEINALQLCLGLRNLGHEADIGTFVYGDPLKSVIEKNKVKVIDLLKEQNDLNYDVIWAHHAPVLSHLLYKHKVADCKILFSSLSSFVSLEAPPIFHSEINLHLVHSKICGHVMEEFGVPSEKIFIFPNYAPENYYLAKRKKLPDNPQKIAIISNHPPQEMRDFSQKAFTRNIDVCFIGMDDNFQFVNQELLNQYDLIVSIGKTIFYCFALSIPVYCYDHFGGPGYINQENFEIAKNNNFSGRGFNKKMTGDELFDDIFQGYVTSKKNLNFLYEKALHEFCLEKNLLSLVSTINDLNITSIDNFRERNKLAEIAYELYREKVLETLRLERQLFEKESSFNKLNQIINDKQQLVEIFQNENNLLAGKLHEIEISKSWKLVLFFRKIRLKFLPINSKSERIAKSLWNLSKKIQRILLNPSDSLIVYNNTVFLSQNNTIPIKSKKMVLSLLDKKRNECVDIIVCVHNALEDVKSCFESIVANTLFPYKLIIVNDGSNDETKNFLESFSKDKKFVTLITNPDPFGYTFSANIGMRKSDSPYFVLLNSDTIVTPLWLEKMFIVMRSDETTGAVGPLSNTASWQSVPKLSENNDWAKNEITGIQEIQKFSANIFEYSGHLWPEVSLLNGFCMLIKKELVQDIGYFDEENFGQGYGEEDDFIIRARKNGWKIRVADDAYVYYAQSKSYTNEKRKVLSAQNIERLKKKHGTEVVRNNVDKMYQSRIFEGIRNRVNVISERLELIEKGKKKFNGQSVLFILPIGATGGGGNVVINEANAMSKMGVKVYIFNLRQYKESFKASYPELEIPQIYGSVDEIPEIAKKFDAVIATANYSVEWLKNFATNTNVKLGYYVQGYEPLMYSRDSAAYLKAKSSYTLISNMRCFSKTIWTKEMVQTNVGITCCDVGISIDIDRFRPLAEDDYTGGPISVVAMIRPGSPYRSPKLTISALRKIKKIYSEKVIIRIYGSDNLYDAVDKNDIDFHLENYGKLTQDEVVSLFSKSDIFVDFSSHQAMGLSALEAMACGCAVIVPQNGGATEFVLNNVNGLAVDTLSQKACTEALKTVINDFDFRNKIRMNAVRDVCKYYVEKSAYNILNFMFG